MLAKLAYPLGGLLFGFALLGAIEGALRIAGVGAEAPRIDPFSGFSSAVEIFEPARLPDGTDIYRMPRSLGRLPVSFDEPQRRFLANPSPDNFRIFVVGGSSTAGIPYTTEYAFSTWLEQLLSRALPEQPIEVVNIGIASYGSRRILPMVRAIAEHSPDLLIVYMGHNESAEASYYQSILELDPRLFRLLEAVYRTHIYRALSRLLPDDAAQRDLEDLEHGEWRREMFAVMTRRGQGDRYPGEREILHRDLLYERNLREMARTMHAVDAEVAFVTLAQNFSDWPPPASRHRSGLRAEEVQQWNRLVQEGDDWASRDESRALVAYRDALAIDDEHASLHFRIAGSYRRLGDLTRARRHYRLASDLDVVPHGAPTSFNEILRRVAGETSSLFVDADAVLIAESGAGLVGDDLFTDFAHPNLRAHQRIARAIAETMREAGIPQPESRWLGIPDDLPTPEALHAANPELRQRELDGRVKVCLVNYRKGCAAEARELFAMSPDNAFARSVLRAASRRRFTQ